MALIVKDRVRETTTTTGTGTLTLAGAVAGFQSFGVIGNANTTYYAIVDPTTGSWEVGLGTYSSSGTTLSRDTVLESSGSGLLVNFGAGSKDVFCTYPAEVSVFLSDVQTLTNKTISADNNTISGIAASSFVLSNASGNIDGSAAQKAIPAGVVVGTTDTQTLTNKTITGGTANPTTLQENSIPAVVQTDIGTAPNEIPLNQHLGNMAFMSSNQVVLNPVASVVPSGIGDMVFQLTSDTSLVVKVKGSDGVIRSATLTLA
jgi:hypothetical protein